MNRRFYICQPAIQFFLVFISYERIGKVGNTNDIKPKFFKRQ
nr:MAG TPA: hypothetical protein [Caudoviricetes sp.]